MYRQVYECDMCEPDEPCTLIVTSEGELLETPTLCPYNNRVFKPQWELTIDTEEPDVD